MDLIVTGEVRSQNRIKYWWCKHCERAWATEQFSIDNDWCPDPECDGGGVGIDIMEWSEFRKKDPWHGTYPKIPEIGKEYPEYDEKWWK
jgi:hypothetical protein